MAKKLITGLAVILFSMVVLVNSPFADFEQIYMTDADGSTTSKTIFDWDETPWLYLRLPQSGLNVTGALWQDPDSRYYFTYSGRDTAQDIWLTLHNWNDVKKLDLWNVKAVYLYPHNPSDRIGWGSTSFTVTPEPISFILFLVGGATLAARRYYKRRRES